MEREALRIHRRYVIEFVERFGMCPWAETARLEGRTRALVMDAESFPHGRALEALAGLAEDEAVEVGFLLFPSLRMSRAAFERHVSELRAADAARAGIGGPPMALAAFHPDAEACLDAPHRLIPFIRRSPDPTIQCVRRTVLDAVRGRGDHGTAFVDPNEVDIREFLTKRRKVPLHEKVASANLGMVRRVGVESMEEVLFEIFADRDAAYARIRGKRG